MKKGKFFYFTISGDNFNPLELENVLKTDSTMYFKGEISVVPHLNNHKIIQKVNRWVYKKINQNSENIKAFLTENLEIILENIGKLETYIKKYDALLELIVYAGDETDIEFDTHQMELLVNIGVSIKVSFC